MRESILLFIILSLFACNTGTPDSSVEVAATETPSISEGLSPLNLSEYGGFKEIMVPNRNRSGVDASAMMDDLSGYVTITAGKGFRMLLREEPTTLEDIKQELENDLMWSNDVETHDEHSIFIERTLPDGSMTTFHFAAVLPGVGSNIVLRSDPMSEFTEKQVKRMLSSAMTMTSTEGLALAK